MEHTQIFSILGIEETKNKKTIQMAYRQKLKNTNPEEKPEEFKKLRSAYEEALVYADSVESQETEVTQDPKDEISLWIGRVEKLYEDITKRGDVAAWEELCRNEICQALDTSQELREALLVFLSYHYHLPHEIWVLLDNTFNIRADMKSLQEVFPKNLLVYIQYYIENATFLPYGYFRYTVEQKEKANPDGFIQIYFTVLSAISELSEQPKQSDFPDIEQKFTELRTFGIYHPYMEVEEVFFLLLKEDYTQAKSKILTLIEAYPKDEYINLAYAKVLFETGQEETAAAIWQKLYEKNKQNAKAAFGLVRYYQKKQDYYRAKKIAEDMLELDLGSANLHALLEQLNTELIVRYEKSLSEQESIYNLSRKEIIYELGWCYLQNKQSEKGLHLMEDTSPEELGEYEYNNLYGRLLLESEQYEKALIFQQKWLSSMETLPTDNKDLMKKRLSRKADAHFYIGFCYGNLQQYTLAQPEIEEACSLAKNQGRSEYYQVSYADLLWKNKKYEQVVDICDGLIKENSSCMPAYVMRQVCCYELERYQQVIYDYYELLNMIPEDASIYRYAARTFVLSFQYEDAEMVLKQAKENQVTFSADMKLLEAILIQHTGDSKEACQKALAILDELEKEARTPQKKEALWDVEDNSEIYYELFLLYSKMDQTASAMHMLKRAIQINPKNTHYHMVSAKMNLIQKRYQEAVHELELCRDVYADSAEYHFYWGIYYMELGQNEDALQEFERSLEIAPIYPYAAENVSDYYLNLYSTTEKKKYYEKALFFLSATLEYLEQKEYILICRGLVYNRGFEYELAIEDFMQALEENENNWAIWNNLACSYRGMGQLEKAISYYNKSCQCSKDATNHLPEYNLVTCYEILHQYEEALHLLQQCSYEWDGEDLIRQGELYCKIKDYKKAYASYNKLPSCYELYQSLVRMLVVEGKAKKIHGNIRIWRFKSNPGKESLCSDEEMKTFYAQQGELYLIGGNYKKAIKYYELALGKVFTSEQIAVYKKLLSFCYFCLGKPQQAQFYAESALVNLEKTVYKQEEYFSFPARLPKRLADRAALAIFMGDKKTADYYLQRIDSVYHCINCKYVECYRQKLLYGILYEALGDFSQALQFYNMTLEIHPLCVQAIHGKQRMKKKKKQNGE
ncbi:MAG: tetratricopeptide repeat protein [Lachnospiraceae bacterium]|nr:tetratricopeptide repeat protein [Lachnospiraceae bacterium]